MSRGPVPPAALAVVWLLGMAAGAPALAESVSSLVEEGNRLYRERRLSEALERYRRAQTQQPGSAALHYNIGNVLYRQEEFAKAYEEYRQAFSARERELAQGARFNAGNTHFARQNWLDAIRNYQEALRLDPSDIDAKRNLELALQKMREEQQKQQSRTQEQDQEQRQDQQDQPQDQEQQRSARDAPRPQPREQESPGQEKERIPREEALRILDAMKEQDRPPKDQIKAPPPDRRPERDW